MAVVEADFGGWATKAGLRCSDGRTIMHGAFEKMHHKRVPLVWQHGHSDPTNILGHAVLEHRDEGVYTYAFFNDTDQGKNARSLVEHGDIKHLSIYANNLVERNHEVFHGNICEVSLVLAGANPGAKIDFVNLQHSDGDVETLEDEAVIHTGIEIDYAYDELQHADGEDDGESATVVADAGSLEPRPVAAHCDIDAVTEHGIEVRAQDDARRGAGTGALRDHVSFGVDPDPLQVEQLQATLVLGRAQSLLERRRRHLAELNLLRQGPFIDQAEPFECRVDRWTLGKEPGRQCQRDARDHAAMDHRVSGASAMAWISISAPKCSGETGTIARVGRWDPMIRA